MLLPCLFHMNRYSCFEKGCLTIGEDYATMSKVTCIMGNGGFYSCLSEPQGVSAWWKETVISLFLVAELL